ncbi:lasso peptide isopeptide bond-forming cyclase [Myceligenerans crystallogenes]|uniref:asparagine synthase (glutamine-hydrolyzing) n=2 Tax=Myceligenerans crystallogenes TaxID=316335 RepID=A0ABP4ZVX6_9MICO
MGAGLPPRPEGSRLLESPYATLWLLGDWPRHQVHVVDGPGWWCATLGEIAVDDAELARQARRFAAGLDPEPLPDRGGNAHVVWADDAKLLMCGDRAGTGLDFHTVHDGLAHFASSPSILADLRGTGIDDLWLALRLISPDAIPGATRSAFDDVAAVPAGSMLLIDDRQIGTAAPRPVVEPDAGLAEGATALRGALEGEIRARLSGTATADLSGGLDSSSVAALAARTATLTGLTLDAGQVDNDDVAHAARIASQLPSLRHETRLIPGEALPYSGLEDVVVTDEPWPDAVLSARTRWWHDQLRALGSTVHLNGDGGDVVLAGSLAYLADLPIGRLFDEARGWGQLRAVAPLPIALAAQRLAGQSPARARRKLAREMRQAVPGRRGPAGQMRWYRQPLTQWFTAGARADAAYALLSEAGSDHHDGLRAGDAIARANVWAFGRHQRLDQQIAEQHGLSIAAPFLTDTVVRACLSVPVAARTSVHAAKPLLQQALAGQVPDDVLVRSTKGNYTALHYRGIQHNRRALRDLLHRPRVAEHDLLDVAPVTGVLERAAGGIEIPLAAFGDVLATEVWLRGQEHRRRTRWIRQEEHRDVHPLPAGRRRDVHAHS